MPITEVVRILARTTGRSTDDRAVAVELVYDTNGELGPDRLASGFPSYWLRVEGNSHGPFADEESAIDAAIDRFSALFD